MRKGKGMLLALITIVMLGALVTTYTKNFVSSNTGSDTMAYKVASNKLTPWQQEASSSKDMTDPELEAKKSIAKTGEVTKETSESPLEKQQIIENAEIAEVSISTEAIQEQLLEEEAVTIVISPLSGSADTDYYEIDYNAKEQERYYLEKLKELEEEMDKMWKEDTDSTTYSIKSTADYEYKLWDKELNAIYGLLRSTLSEEDAKELKKEELEWMKSRDTKALEAANRRSGSSMEGLEYILSMTISTKERTYELVRLYFQEE